jgi:hypothetical protein
MNTAGVHWTECAVAGANQVTRRFARAGIATLRFVRIGTLDEAATIPPDVHPYVRSVRSDSLAEQDGFELSVPVVLTEAAITAHFRCLHGTLKPVGEPLASAPDQSDVCVGPSKGAGRHDTQALAES